MGGYPVTLVIFECYEVAVVTSWVVGHWVLDAASGVRVYSTRDYVHNEVMYVRS